MRSVHGSSTAKTQPKDLCRKARETLAQRLASTHELPQARVLHVLNILAVASNINLTVASNRSLAVAQQVPCSQLRTAARAAPRNSSRAVASNRSPAVAKNSSQCSRALDSNRCYLRIRAAHAVYSSRQSSEELPVAVATQRLGSPIEDVAGGTGQQKTTCKSGKRNACVSKVPVGACVNSSAVHAEKQAR